MTNFAFPATLSTGDGVATVTAFNVNAENPIYVANESHPAWDDILDGLRRGDSTVWDLFDVASGIMSRFREVTDRVSYNGSEVLFDGDPIHSVLADQLRRAIEDGNSENYTALAKFWEKLESNPNAHSREQAYDFLASHSFQITAEGDVVGYKGVGPTAVSGQYESSFSSGVWGKPSAYVNGIAQPPMSKVTQSVGDVVSMPRSEVTHDPSRACERGLHVATRGYASGYASGALLEVHFNPRDIVSVPTADSGAKVRVCRYKVHALAGDESNYVSPVQITSGWVGDVGYRV